tara:strand:- start:1327 stop:1890 length:564 start_codon:yes stop_codon:yes gene_type:complete
MRNYYTYAYLREDATPYYIGKGKCESGRHLHKNHHAPIPPKERILILKDDISEDDALKHEIYMISVFGRKDNNTGILRNLTDGGDGKSGWKASKETCDKISKALTGKKRNSESNEKQRIAMTGRKLTDEHKKNIANGVRGMRHSIDAKMNMSIAAKKRGNNREGTKHSDETKEKIRQAALKRWKKYE